MITKKRISFRFLPLLPQVFEEILKLLVEPLTDGYYLAIPPKTFRFNTMESRKTEAPVTESDKDDFLGVKLIEPLASVGDICETFQSGNESVTEFRIIEGQSCTNTPFGRVCIPVPVGQSRTCTKTLFAQFCVPAGTEGNVKQAIRDCIIAGIATGIVATIIASPAAFLPTLKVSVQLCLIRKGVEIAFDLKLGLWVESDCGDWG